MGFSQEKYPDPLRTQRIPKIPTGFDPQEYAKQPQIIYRIFKGRVVFPLVYSCKICYHISRRRSILVKAPFSRQGLKILRRAHR